MSSALAKELNNVVVLIQYDDKPLKAKALIFITYEALKVYNNIYNKQEISLLRQVGAGYVLIHV